MTRKLQQQLLNAIQAEHEYANRLIEQMRDALVALEYNGDTAERGRIIGERRILVEAIVQAHELVERTGAALERARNRQFGVCLDCGEEIQERRLRVQPWSERCIACQQAAEFALISAAPARDFSNARVA